MEDDATVYLPYNIHVTSSVPLEFFNLEIALPPYIVPYCSLLNIYVGELDRNLLCSVI